MPGHSSELRDATGGEVGKFHARSSETRYVVHGVESQHAWTGRNDWASTFEPHRSKSTPTSRECLLRNTESRFDEIDVELATLGGCAKNRPLNQNHGR
jgi:hypothetical protein